MFYQVKTPTHTLSQEVAAIRNVGFGLYSIAHHTRQLVQLDEVFFSTRVINVEQLAC